MSAFTDFAAEQRRMVDKVRQARQKADNAHREWVEYKRRRLWTRVLVVAFLLTLAGVLWL